MRHANDFYATPACTTRAILPHLPLAGRVLEPSAGNGAIVRELIRAGVGADRIAAIEIDEAHGPALEALGVLTCLANFVDRKETEGHERAYDLVVGNPPYSAAEAHVRRALECCRRGGTVAMLLRLAFLESASRVPFHAAHPSDVYVLPRRPSFTGNGKTDASAYAWFVFGPGRGGHWSVLRMPESEAA